MCSMSYSNRFSKSNYSEWTKSKFKSPEIFFHPSRYIPPINPNGDINMSLVESKTFFACRSVQNIQSLVHTNGINKYWCKYVSKIDQNDIIIVKANSHNSNKLQNEGYFPHNSKITTSAINEKKTSENKRSNKYPTGRAVAQQFHYSGLQSRCKDLYMRLV